MSFLSRGPSFYYQSRDIIHWKLSFFIIPFHHNYANLSPLKFYSLRICHFTPYWWVNKHIVTQYRDYRVENYIIYWIILLFSVFAWGGGNGLCASFKYHLREHIDLDLTSTYQILLNTVSGNLEWRKTSLALSPTKMT